MMERKNQSQSLMGSLWANQKGIGFFLLPCFLFLPLIFYSQTYFNKVYPLANATGSRGVSPRQSGGYIVWAVDLNLGFLRPMILDEQGDTVSTKLIDVSGQGFADYMAWGGVTAIPHSPNFLTTGGFHDSMGTGTNYSYLTKWSEDGDTLWHKSWRIEIEEYANGIFYTQDHHVLITGVTEVFNNNPSPYLMKFDTLGNVIWRRVYGPGNNWGGIKSVQNSNGNIVMGGGFNLPNSRSDPFLIIADSLGLNEIVYDYKPGSNAQGCIVDTLFGSGRIFRMGYEMVGSNIESECSVLDSSGQALWVRNFNGQGLDGWAVGSASKSKKVYSVYWAESWLDAILLGFNHQTGELTDSTVIPRPALCSNVGPIHFAATPDGGFIVCGSAGYSLTGTPQCWVAKMDSVGCVFSGCPIMDRDTSIAEAKIRIYPNPGQSRVQLEYPAEIKHLEIFNLTGEKIASYSLVDYKNNLDVSFLSPGLYLFQFVAGNGQRMGVRFLKE